MKKKYLSFLFYIICFSCFSQEYSLLVSRNPNNFFRFNTSYGSSVQSYSFSYNEGDFNTTDTYNLPSGSSLSGTYRGYGGPAAINYSCERVLPFTHNKLTTLILASNPEDVNSIVCKPPLFIYNSYPSGSNFNITLFSAIIPKYTQPSIENRERIATDKLFLTSENTFSELPVNLLYVNWQYQVNGNTFAWFDFPVSVRNKFPMNSTVEEILSEYFGQIETVNTLRVRVVLAPPPSYEEPYINIFEPITVVYMPNTYSDILTFDILQPSPQLLDFTPTNTLCSYSKDGSFSMKLDRNLKTGDELVVLLYTESVANSGNFDQIPNGGQQGTDELTPNEDGITYSYHWPNYLAPGNYKVKYQSHKIGEPNPDWASIVHSPQFTIRSPDPVTFSVPLQTINNVNCFGGNDGSFIITAKGGGGGYKYFLNNDAAVFFNNTNKGTDALPISQTIGNLKASSNTIKSQDANGCTEQE